jgi:cytochrome b involved in lipid metabolism
MNKTAYVGIIVVLIIAVSGYYLVKGRDWDGDEAYEYETSEQTESATNTPSETANGGSSATATTTNTPAASTFTMAEVAKHADRSSCYSVVRGGVYDFTKWISTHPGGEKAILGTCGKDGTSMFEKQHGGKGAPEKALASMKIGTLAQ